MWIWVNIIQQILLVHRNYPRTVFQINCSTLLPIRLYAWAAIIVFRLSYACVIRWLVAIHTFLHATSYPTLLRAISLFWSCCLLFNRNSHNPFGISRHLHSCFPNHVLSVHNLDYWEGSLRPKRKRDDKREGYWAAVQNRIWPKQV